MGRKSNKTKVIERIFRKRFNRADGTLSDPVVTLTDLEAAIRPSDRLSKGNVANFWKDLTRHDVSQHWPASVLKAGYIGEDAIGEAKRAAFKFVPIEAAVATVGDAISFEASRVPVRDVQSLSMPVATKALGRADENWLAQVAARLSVVETHFALFSSRQVQQVDFLQTGVRLRTGEADVVYSLLDDAGETWLVCAEAKGMNESLHLPQIRRAAAALYASYISKKKVNAAGVIPFGIKVAGTSLIHTVEFEPITGGAREDALVLASEGAVRLVPAVTGVG